MRRILLTPFLGRCYPSLCIFSLPLRYEVVRAVALIDPVLWPRFPRGRVHTRPFNFVFVTALSRNFFYRIEDLVVIFLGNKLGLEFGVSTRVVVGLCLVRCHDVWYTAVLGRRYYYVIHNTEKHKFSNLGGMISTASCLLALAFERVWAPYPTVPAIVSGHKNCNCGSARCHCVLPRHLLPSR